MGNAVICLGLKNAQALSALFDKLEDECFELSKEQIEIKRRVQLFVTDVLVSKRPVRNRHAQGGCK